MTVVVLSILIIQALFTFPDALLLTVFGSKLPKSIGNPNKVMLINSAGSTIVIFTLFVLLVSIYQSYVIES